MSAAAYRSLLVPLDGSPFSEQALPLATVIAQRAGALLQLAMVHHPVPALATALEVPEIEAQLDQEARAREQAYLDGLVQRLRSEANVPVSAVLLDGPVAEALELHLEASAADLVVVTTHGRGPLSRFWLGSVADQLMRRLHLPILFLRPQAEAPGVTPIGRLLVTLDGSAFAETALEGALSLGRTFGADYTLLMVVEPPMPLADPNGLMILPPSEEVERQLLDQAEGYLARVAARLQGEGARVETRVVQGPSVANAILEEAGRCRADLIVLASHGAGGFERFVVGSVADKVIRGSTHPTLVIRPPKATR